MDKSYLFELSAEGGLTVTMGGQKAYSSEYTPEAIDAIMLILHINISMQKIGLEGPNSYKISNI